MLDTIPPLEQFTRGKLAFWRTRKKQSLVTLTINILLRPGLTTETFPYLYCENKSIFSIQITPSFSLQISRIGLTHVVPVFLFSYIYQIKICFLIASVQLFCVHSGPYVFILP